MQSLLVLFDLLPSEPRCFCARLGNEGFRVLSLVVLCLAGRLLLLPMRLVALLLAAHRASLANTGKGWVEVQLAKSRDNAAGLEPVNAFASTS